MPSERPPGRSKPKPRRMPQLAFAKSAARSSNHSIDQISIPVGSRTLRSKVSDDLDRFRRGEMTEQEYLQARIDRATLHLRGRVSSHKLERIRKIVTEACASDPVLRAMRERLFRSR